MLAIVCDFALRVPATRNTRHGSQAAVSAPKPLSSATKWFSTACHRGKTDAGTGWCSHTTCSPRPLDKISLERQVGAIQVRDNCGSNVARWNALPASHFVEVQIDIDAMEAARFLVTRLPLNFCIETKTSACPARLCKRFSARCSETPSRATASRSAERSQFGLLATPADEARANAEPGSTRRFRLAAHQRVWGRRPALVLPLVECCHGPADSARAELHGRGEQSLLDPGVERRPGNPVALAHGWTTEVADHDGNPRSLLASYGAVTTWRSSPLAL